MKSEEEQNDRVISLLKQYRLATSTPVRRERALATARSAWTTAAPDEPVSQRRPFLRFATSVAATIVLVFFTHLWDEQTLAHRQFSPTTQRDGSIPEITAEVTDIDPVLAQELMFLHTIRIHDADRVTNNWFINQELLHELIDLEMPGASNSQDEPSTTRKQFNPATTWLIARNLSNIQYPTWNSRKSV